MHFNAKQTPRVLAHVSFVREIQISPCRSFLRVFEPLSRIKPCNLLLPRNFLLNIQGKQFAWSVKMGKKKKVCKIVH